MNLQSSSLISLTPPKTGIQFKFFIIFLTLFASTWLIANIAAVKMVTVFGIVFTGGFIIFPLTSMFNILIVEVYGYKNSRQAIWAGFLLNVAYVFFINIVNIIPSSPYWHMDKQFQNILVPETRIVAASLFSFLIADFINSYLMAKMKIKSNGGSLVKRILIASSISLSFDLCCFITLAFYKTMPDYFFIKLLFSAYWKKILCQLFLFPLVCYLIALLKKLEGIELYDYDTQFNPFSLDNAYEIPTESNNNVIPIR